MFSSVSEERGDGLFALQRFDKSFHGLRENGLLRAFGNHFIRISGEHGENFRAIRGREVRTTGAHRNLALTGSAACAKVFKHFRAEGFHRTPASNLSRSRLLYRRLWEFQRVA